MAICGRAQRTRRPGRAGPTNYKAEFCIHNHDSGCDLIESRKAQRVHGLDRRTRHIYNYLWSKLFKSSIVIRRRAACASTRPGGPRTSWACGCTWPPTARAAARRRSRCSPFETAGRHAPNKAFPRSCCNVYRAAVAVPSPFLRHGGGAAARRRRRRPAGRLGPARPVLFLSRRWKN